MHPEAKPPRSSRTREEILRSARARFSADGYERTTIRAVAADASIDPSMVMRYYGNKSGLFAAATEFDLALPDLLRVPRENLGAAAVEHFLTRWEGEEGDDALRVLLASAATNPTAAAQMHSIFSSQLAPVVSAAGSPDLTSGTAPRAALIATQMLGLALCRYVLRLPPVIQFNRAELVAWIAPVIQHYLTDPLA